MSAPRQDGSSSEIPRESVLVKFIVAPLMFLSFLVSLALVDMRNASLQQRNHSPSSHPAAPRTLFGRAKDVLYGLMLAPVPNPYAYVKSPDLVEREKSMTGDVGKSRRTEGEGSWYWNTKKRKMLKMELADALELRKKVVVVLIVMGVGMGVLGLWIVNWSVGAWRGTY